MVISISHFFIERVAQMVLDNPKRKLSFHTGSFHYQSVLYLHAAMRDPIADHTEFHDGPYTSRVITTEEGLHSLQKNSSVPQKKRLRKGPLTEIEKKLEKAASYHGAILNERAKARCLWSIAYGEKHNISQFMSFARGRKGKLVVFTGLPTDPVPRMTLLNTEKLEEEFSRILTASEVKTLETRILKYKKKLDKYTSERKRNPLTNIVDLEDKLCKVLKGFSSIQLTVNNTYALGDIIIYPENYLEVAWQIAFIYENGTDRQIQGIALIEGMPTLNPTWDHNFDSVVLSKIPSQWQGHSVTPPRRGVDYKQLQEKLTQSFPQYLTPQKIQELEVATRALLN